jgi:hypothetical protein
LTIQKGFLAITQYLMEEETEEIINYLNQNYPDFSDKQRQALLFTICRTIANQYVTGLASEEEFHHPYLEHQENYMVVSPSGKPFGRFDITQQSFGSVPANREEMLDHVKTKLLLLEANQADKPYILFISSPINRTILDQPDVTLIAAEDAARAYFQVLFNDTEIRKRAEQGSLVIIPILIDEENGRILEIGDYSFYLN